MTLIGSWWVFSMRSLVEMLSGRPTVSLVIHRSQLLWRKSAYLISIDAALQIPTKSPVSRVGTLSVRCPADEADRAGKQSCLGTWVSQAFMIIIMKPGIICVWQQVIRAFLVFSNPSQSMLTHSAAGGIRLALNKNLMLRGRQWAGWRRWAGWRMGSASRAGHHHQAEERHWQ